MIDLIMKNTPVQSSTIIGQSRCVIEETLGLAADISTERSAGLGSAQRAPVHI